MIMAPDDDNMIRLPFLYYNVKNPRVGYTTENYTTPKKGYKLHPVHSQHARGVYIPLSECVTII